MNALGKLCRLAARMLRSFWEACAQSISDLTRVHLVSDKGLEEIGFIAIGIYAKGAHTGILHRRTPNSPLMLTHLCAHRTLVKEPHELRHCRLWVEPLIDPDQAEQVAAQCRLLERLYPNGEFPYAFSSPRGFFTPDLQFEYGPGKLGLTCATLALAIFDSVGVEVVDWDSWPIRADDLVFRETLIAAMNMPESHKSAIRSDPVGPRYKPLEVAGAVGAGKYPVHFRRANWYANRLAALLRNST